MAKHSLAKAQKNCQAFEIVKNYLKFNALI